MRGTSQEVTHTRSRWSGPRKWRGAVVWLIAAGLHPRANATTQQVADDLADRMDYSTGHVRYGLDEMAARLGIGRASVARHVSYLRELGALAWAQHGSRVNVRRPMGLKGYAATATVYAAVIPAVYDHAMGHTIVGTGYGARIVIDQRSQTRIPAQSSGPVDNSPVDNSVCEERETPSLTWVKEEGKLKMVGGSNYTSQARPPKPRIPHQSNQINGRRRTAADVQAAGKTVRLVRALVNWTQSVPLRRLEYVLRPWTDRGQDAYQIAADLTGMCSGMRWKPTNPAAFIQAGVTAETEHQQQAQAAQAAADRWEQENPAEGAFHGSVAARLDVMAAHRQGLARYQQQMRAYGHDDLSTGASSDWDAEADILAFLNGSPA
ncbi:cell wall protein [Streptomyces sp. NPDC048288]|uniref:cell wall protein n=1 Tax=Streptomyces sp. NPDC048288 TaxID=3365529 RepID=UPI003717249F